jgi:hypothetical protein
LNALDAAAPAFALRIRRDFDDAYRRWTRAKYVYAMLSVDPGIFSASTRRGTAAPTEEV